MSVFVRHTKRVRMSHALRGVTLGLVLLTSCQKAGDEAADTKSLDNFAAGRTVSVNSCRGAHGSTMLAKRWMERIRFDKSLETALGEADKTRYRKQVETYLTAIPAEVQELFLDLGGEIMLSDKASKLCSQGFADRSSSQFLAEARQGMESCMIYAQAEADQAGHRQAVLAVFHQVDIASVRSGATDDNVKRILHGGVRAFGLAFGQFFSKLGPNGDGAELENGIRLALTQTDATKMSSLKRRIANDFLIDLAESDAYDLATLESLLGVGAAAAIRQGLSGAGAVAAAEAGTLDLLALASFKYAAGERPSAEARQIRRQRFEDFVFGEAFDSFYCSQATRQTMTDDFARTATRFASLAGEVLAHARSLKAYAGGETDDVVTAAGSGEAQRGLGLTYQDAFSRSYGSNCTAGYADCIGCGCSGGNCTVGCPLGCSGATCGCTGGACGGGGGGDVSRLGTTGANPAMMGSALQSILPFAAAFLPSLLS